MSLLYQKVCEVGIAFPCLRNYCQASWLVAMREWGRTENQDVWLFEQDRVSIPLKEWTLIDPGLRPTITSHNSVLRAIIKIVTGDSSPPVEVRLVDITVLEAERNVGKTYFTPQYVLVPHPVQELQMDNHHLKDKTKP